MITLYDCASSLKKRLTLKRSRTPSIETWLVSMSVAVSIEH